MPDVDLSMFSTPMAWKISPDEQASRDAQANSLRQEYEPGSPTIQEDDAGVRKAVRKQGSYDVFAKAEPTPDMSMFEGEAEPKVDMSMFAEEKSNVAKMTSGAMTAVDFLAPVGTVLGGISALGGMANDFVSGQGVDLNKAVGRTHQYEDWNPSGIAQKLGVPKEYVESKIAQVPMEKLQELSRMVGEKVQDATGSAGLATGTDVAIQAAVIALLFKGGMKAGEKTIKTPERAPAGPPEAPKAPDVSNGMTDLPPGGSIDPRMMQRDMLDEMAAKDSPWKIDENGMPYRDLMSEVKQKDLFNQETAYDAEGWAEPKADPHGAMDYVQGEKESLSSSKNYDLSRSKDKFGNEIDYYPENPDSAQRAYKGVQEDQAWKQRQGELDIEQKAQAADDATRATPLKEPYEPSQSGVAMERSGTPRSPNAGKFGQGGAVDFSAFKITSDTQKPLVENIVAGFKFIKKNWPRFAENTDIQILDQNQYLQRISTKYQYEDLQGAAAFYDAKIHRIFLNLDNELFKDASPRNFAEVLAHELTHGLQETRGRFDKSEWKSKESWKKAWADRPWEQEALKAEATVRNRPINKGTFGQSGAVNLDFRQGRDHRPWEEIKSVLGFSASKPLKASEDMGKANRALNVAPVMKQITKGRVGDLMSNIISRTQEWQNQGTNRYRDAVTHLKPLSDLGRKSKLKIADVSTKFDGLMNDELAGRGLQWPTRDMLLEKGLSDKEAHAYLEQTKGVDKGFDMIDETLRLAGQDPVTRIPGYFPHFWTGSYKVKLIAEGKTISMKGFSTRWMADKFMRDSQRAGLDVVPDYPTSHIKPNNIAASIIEGMNIYASKKGLGKPLLDMLTQFDEMSKRGIIKSALERETNIAGFDAEQGVTNNWANNNRLIDAYKTYLESTSAFWTNGQIARDVYAPFLRDIRAFENTPHFKAAVGEFIQRNTGQPLNHLAWIDENLRAMGISAGLPPNTLSTIVQGLGSFMTFSKLIIPNPRFLAAQIVQPIAAAADISMFHEKRAAAGLPTGNPLKAWATLLKEFGLVDTPMRSKDANLALEWAIKNNKIDVYQADHINPVKSTNALYHTNDTFFYRFPRWIEERGRKASFLANYDYFKDVMPREEAYHAAANSIDINMGNYESGNSASMFTDLGVVGRSMRPFALIRNAYMGKALMAAQMAKDGLAQGRPQAMTPLGLMLGSYILVAGGTGMFGANEWDVFARWYNASFKPDVPFKRPGEFMKEYGLPNWAVYGALGDALGMDVGPSMAAPAMNELVGIPALSAGQAAWTLASEAVKEVGGSGANVQNVYGALKTIAPNIMQEPMENWVAQKQGGNIPGSTSFDATIQRTDKEANTYRWTGAKAISEVSRRSENSLFKSNMANTKVWKTEQVSKIVDAMLGESQDDTSKLIGKAIEARRGFDAQSLREAIKAELTRREVEEKLRNLSAIAKSNNSADKAYRMETLQMLEQK